MSTWSASIEHMERHVGMARGRPHVARGWREWRQSSRDGGALLPRRRRLRTVRAAGSARRYFIGRHDDLDDRCLVAPHSGYK